jgi:hypothetical protein
VQLQVELILYVFLTTQLYNNSLHFQYQAQRDLFLCSMDFAGVGISDPNWDLQRDHYESALGATYRRIASITRWQYNKGKLLIKIVDTNHWQQLHWVDSTSILTWRYLKISFPLYLLFWTNLCYFSLDTITLLWCLSQLKRLTQLPTSLLNSVAFHSYSIPPLSIPWDQSIHLILPTPEL